MKQYQTISNTHMPSATLCYSSHMWGRWISTTDFPASIAVTPAGIKECSTSEATLAI